MATFLPPDDIQKFKYCHDTMTLKRRIEGSFIELAERLYNIKEQRLYEPQWTSFLEFCLEFKMSQNNINKMMKIYEIFVLRYAFPRDQIRNAGVSLLIEVLPVVRTHKHAIKWLEKATLLTRSDLRRELTEFRTGVPMVGCKHEDTYSIRICRTCGERTQEM